VKYLIIKGDFDSFENYFNVKMQEYSCDVLNFNYFHSKKTSRIRERIDSFVKVARLSKRGILDKYDRIIIFGDLNCTPCQGHFEFD
jgi:hypothetical protein